jgi:hypothetical protein
MGHTGLINQKGLIYMLTINKVLIMIQLVTVYQT